MKKLAILPRGGLGDVLYHALFARYIERVFPGVEPVLIAPKYAAFLTSLLGVQHVAACSVLTDASGGLKLGGELEFFGAFLKNRGGCLASFTNDVVDHGLARAFGLSLFDGGALGNWLFVQSENGGVASRTGVNRLLGYHQHSHTNPKHIIDRQRHALARHGLKVSLPESYREIWKTTVATIGEFETDSRLVLIFPETAALAKNLTFEQVESMVRQLRPEYRIRVFTRNPACYAQLGVETAGFADRLEPIRQISQAAAVITGDTFPAHLAGLCGTPTYVVYNRAYRPVWCEYWGSPFENVLHFEDGKSYRLDRELRGLRVEEESVIYEVVGEAAEVPNHLDRGPVTAAFLTGSSARC